MKPFGGWPGIAGLVFAAALVAGFATLAGKTATAAEIRYVVNDVPVTSYDIDRRVAFLRLQRQSGNLQEKAAEDMIEQTLRLQEMRRLNIDIGEEEVDQAFANFASRNNISAAQLNTALAQAGVTTAHFKDFIRSQIGWSRVLQARFQGGGGRMTEQEAVQKMLQQGGQKPTATEYILQQVIFVIPEGERSALLGQRKREAQAMRDRFQNCETTRNFAKGLIDVTVRDLGRVLEPELPPNWKDQVVQLSPGSATDIRETERGVEFIGVCSSREVSDDRVAAMVFQSEESNDETAERMTEKYMTELREQARIVER